MTSLTRNVLTWFTKGTYPRLYLPILVIVVAVVGVRYHFLLGYEVAEARERARTELSRMEHFVVPALRNVQGDLPAIQKQLEEEVRFVPLLESLSWQDGSSTLTARNPPPQPVAVPAWFVRLVNIDRLESKVDVPLADGRVAVFRAAVRPNASVDEVWRILRPQMMLTGLNVATIFLLLTLMLRANARMLRRLTTATEGFQSGSLGTRMEVKGTLEMRAVADTFNGMAGQIEQLVRSLQQSEAEQADQLHFTRQLIDSLPLPVFVRSVRGICLVVNPAWEQMFGLSSAAVVGTPMPSYFNALEEDIIDISDANDSGFLTTTSQEVYSIQVHGETRYVLYFKAPFTNRNGVPMGTIATLVDVTERERANHTLL